MPYEPRTPDGRIQRDVDDEIAFHLESRISELMQRGHSEDAARRTAETEFGDLRASRRELTAVDQHRRRGERLAQAIDATAQDLRHAARSLRRSPAFTMAATLTLVIGMGATVAMFALVNGVLLRPLPYGHPEQLVGAWHDMPPIGLVHAQQSPATYFTYLRLARTIEGIGVYREGEVNVAEPAGGVEPQRMTSASVSATLIRVLQVSPILGRAFTAAEDRPGAPPVMLISEGMWRARFGADPRIIGHRLDVNGVSREITGVLPARFHMPSAATQLWLPLQLDAVNPPATAFSYTGIARLKSGVTIAEAERDFASVLPSAPDVVPLFVPGISTRQILDQVRPRPVLVPLRADITGGIARTLWTVACAAMLLLLIACANVANLTLVRADARHGELALREALGAGRGRIVLHFFAESAIVAALASVMGLAVAATAVRALVSAGPAMIPRLTEVKVDATTALFSLAAATLVAITCSVIAAMRAGGGYLGLRAGGRGGTAGRRQHRVRGGLVAAQVALALVVSQPRDC